MIQGTLIQRHTQKSRVLHFPCCKIDREVDSMQTFVVQDTEEGQHIDCRHLIVTHFNKHNDLLWGALHSIQSINRTNTCLGRCDHFWRSQRSNVSETHGNKLIHGGQDQTTVFGRRQENSWRKSSNVQKRRPGCLKVTSDHMLLNFSWQKSTKHMKDWIPIPNILDSPQKDWLSTETLKKRRSKVNKLRFTSKLDQFLASSLPCKSRSDWLRQKQKLLRAWSTPGILKWRHVKKLQNASHCFITGSIRRACSSSSN